MSSPYADLVDIIQTEMGLVDGQVMQANQRWPIPTREGLYIVLQSISPKPIASKVWIDDLGVGGVFEVKDVSMVDLVQIDVMSADMSAVTRRQEVLGALRSIYSEQKQTEKGFQIARLPQTFSNASNLEGASQLNRFVATIAVAWIDSIRKATTQYYETIPTPEVTPNA